MHKNKKECGCCQVEAIVSVDERGQMVLPKEVRDKADIKAGDKLAVVSSGDKDCCRAIGLIKAKDLEGKAKEMLGPLAK